MESSQHTLKESISLSGIGLHSGYKVKLNIKPAGPTTVSGLN